jgi:hypothetical protein
MSRCFLATEPPEILGSVVVGSPAANADVLCVEMVRPKLRAGIRHRRPALC